MSIPLQISPGHNKPVEIQQLLDKADGVISTIVHTWICESQVIVLLYTLNAETFRVF